MFKLLWSTRYALLLGTAIAGYWGYQSWSGSAEDDTAQRQAMASQLARRIALALPLPDHRARLAVASVPGDDQGLLAAKLQAWIRRRNVTLCGSPWWKPLLPAALQPTSPGTDQACEQAAGRGIDYLVAAEVEQWVTMPGERPQLTVQVQLRDTRLHTVLYEQRFSLDDGQEPLNTTAAGDNRPESDKASARLFETSDTFAGSLGIGPGFVVWLAVSLLLPWSLWRVIKQVLVRHSNLASLLLVAGCLVCVALLGWILWGHDQPQGPAIVLLAAICTLWIGYLEFVCRCVATVEGT